jgi:hypothetical protein
MASSWSSREVDLIIVDYFAMFLAEVEGRPYCKAAHRKTLSAELDGRSDSSIERKHMNISAVLRDLSMPFIDGYKPYGNYQGILADHVITFLTHHSFLEERFQELASETTSVKAISEADLTRLIVEPPDLRIALDRSPFSIRKSPANRDYVAMDDLNRRLGDSGEEFVLELERKRLHSEGRRDLAETVEWVARTRGPSAGFDIASFHPSGEARMIEVKTTNYGHRFPFHVTVNELEVSRRNRDKYRLYRVFQFSRQKRLFILRPPLEDHCRLAPELYKASF